MSKRRRRKDKGQPPQAKASASQSAPPSAPPAVASDAPQIPPSTRDKVLAYGVVIVVLIWAIAFTLTVALSN